MANMSNGTCFSAAQLKAMDRYIHPYVHAEKLPTIKWNIEYATSDVWKQCLELIISDYKDALSSSPIAETAITELTSLSKKKNIKKFFLSHLLTSPDQIETRLRQFTDRTRGEGYYLCLMPSSLSSFVEWKRMSGSIFSRTSVQLDLLIDVDEKDGHLIEASKQEKPYYAFSCALPYDQETVNRITTCFDSSIMKPNWVMRTVVVASIAVGVLMLAKQSSVRQLWKRLISS